MVLHISCMHFLIMIDGTADIHAYLGLVPAAHMIGWPQNGVGSTLSGVVINYAPRGIILKSFPKRPMQNGRTT